MKVEDLMQELGRPEPSGEGAGTNTVSQAVKRVAWRSRRVLGMGRAREQGKNDFVAAWMGRRNGVRRKQ